MSLPTHTSDGSVWAAQSRIVCNKNAGELCDPRHNCQTDTTAYYETIRYRLSCEMVRLDKLEHLAAQYLALNRAERLAFINMIAGIAQAEARVENIDRQVDAAIAQALPDNPSSYQEVV